MKIKHEPKAALFRARVTVTDAALKPAIAAKAKIDAIVDTQRQKTVDRKLAELDAANYRRTKNPAAAAALRKYQESRMRDMVVSDMRIKDAMKGRKPDPEGVAQTMQDASRILQDASRKVTLGKKLK